MLGLTACGAPSTPQLGPDGKPLPKVYNIRHFGADGSSPIDRALRVGYTGTLVGENISETYETELETLAAWMEDENTRRVILSPDATDLGFAWFQESNGKIWWTMVTGSNRFSAPGTS